MLLNFMVHVSISLLVVFIMIEDSTGIILQLKQGPRLKHRRKLKMCKFDNRNYTVGHTWHPYLEPDGLNLCITCKCQKSGLTQCSRKKCPPVSCSGKKIPQGKCCPVCSAKPPPSQKSCYYKGKHYNSGQVWETTMADPNGGSSNCAECACRNGLVSCSIRICLTLKCSTFFQRKVKNSCCKDCGGLPLQEEGAKEEKHTKDLAGSCFKDGFYYKDRDLWNPVTPPSEMRAFQYPNCRLCSCKNSNISCKPVVCPSLNCKNPKKKNPNDCCKSCPDQVSPAVSPIIYRSIPETKPKARIYPNCMFANKVYLHNTSWTPQIPGLTLTFCARCTCVLSKVRCNRTQCNNGGRCNNCSVVSNTKLKTTKPKVQVTGQRDCSGKRVKVYLLDNGRSKKTKTRHTARQYSFIKIALEYQLQSYIKVHHWDVSENKVSIRDSKLRKSRFEKRKSNYKKLGETKFGRVNRFLNKQKSLTRCRRNCKYEATKLINFLTNRVKYFKKECRSTRSADTFRSLIRPSLL